MATKKPRGVPQGIFKLDRKTGGNVKPKPKPKKDSAPKGGAE